MVFKRVKTIGEGTYIVMVKKVNVKDCKNGMQILNLYLISKKREEGVFSIFTNNSRLINKLIKIAYKTSNIDDDNDESVDEKIFIDIKMKIETKKDSKGYIKIVDITELDSRN